MASNDRDDRISAMESLELKLKNEKRGDIETMCDYIVEQGRAIKLILKTDFVKKEEFDAFKKPVFGWPAALATIGLMSSVTGLIIRFAPQVTP